MGWCYLSSFIDVFVSRNLLTFYIALVVDEMRTKLAKKGKKTQKTKQKLMLKGKFNQKCLQYGHGHRAWTLIYIVRTYRFHCLGWKRGPCVVLFQRLAYQMLSSAIRNNLILRSFFKFIVDRCSVLCVRFAHCPLPIVKFRKKEITRENKWKTRLWIGIIKIKLTYRFVSELFVWLRWSDDYSSFFVFFFYITY